VLRFKFDLRSQAPLAACAQHSSNSRSRTQLWPGLPADQYEVYGVRDTWAEIREDYRGPTWGRERYN
jgi:hypothetical protein